MPDTTLAELLGRNKRHTESIADDHFSTVEDVQQPAAVSICCSDSRVSQEGMWDVTEPGWLFTPSTIGNQVWDQVDGELVVDGSLLYPIQYTETDVTLVVGHTGCGAVTAALEAVREGSTPNSPGIGKWVDLLTPVIEEGLKDDSVDPSSDASLVDQLVEYNVDRQVDFLRESQDVPESEQIYGFVYDFQGVYGDVRGRTYLVNANGVTAPGKLRELISSEFAEYVKRLL